MVATEEDVEQLRKLDMGDFADEVERLVGKETYRAFLRAGKGMEDICNEILQMINVRNTPLPHETQETLCFKDKAAQCCD